ncbi:GNAT family N-acetyltransferase [Flavonifractor hominis]|uniref:GNAT family N-acetyltransferase n=1 Tax=Flavonifractor hominis TaxID=3133178 RepID=A0ABV1ERJ2_9FIRM
MRPFVFRSPRLGFLAADPALAAPAAAFYRRNRAAFAPFDPVQPEEFFTEAGQRERLAWELEQAEQGRCFRFLLVQPRHPGKIVGMVGLNEIVRGAFQSCFLSYKIDHTLWGRGYGSEAIDRATGWAFRTLHLHRVEANIMPRNLASRRAAAKAGYEEEGLAKHYLKINGVWEDHIHMVKRDEEEFHA